MQKIVRTFRDLLPRLALLLALATAMGIAGPAAEASSVSGHHAHAHQAAAMPHAPGHDCGTAHMPDAVCLQACLGAVIAGDDAGPAPVLLSRRLPQDAPGELTFRDTSRAPQPRPPEPVFA